MSRETEPLIHQSEWVLWVCCGCGARAEWTGYRKSCGRCGSRDREQIETQRRSECRRPITFDRDDVDAAAARLAYWWRMSFSADYSEPECEAPYWDMPARMALRAVAEDRTRHPEGFHHADH